MRHKIFNFKFFPISSRISDRSRESSDLDGKAIGTILNCERGATAILMSLFVMMIILLIALTVANIMLFEIKMSREIGNSIPAFYAADAGAEQCLYEARKTSSGCANVGGTVSYSLSNGAAVFAQRTGAQRIDAGGNFSQTNRKIQVDW